MPSDDLYPSEKTAQIDAALALNPPPRVRVRLKAVRRVLEGASPLRAAKLARVHKTTMMTWLRLFRENGCSALTRDGRFQARPGCGNRGKVLSEKWPMTASALRERSATESDRELKRRLVALSFLADGLGFVDASLRAKVGHAALSAWKRRFMAGGVDAVKPKRRGAQFKISDEQMEFVADFVRRHPTVGFEEIRAHVKAQLGIAYTVPGIRRLVMETLGLRRWG
jgi:transposase